MRETLFIIAIACLAILLTWLLVRWWESHRQHPSVLREHARDLWARTGLHWWPPAYLTLHAVAGLVVIVVGVSLFAVLADWVTDQEAITRFDVQFDETLHAHTSPLGVRIASGVSFIGGPTGMTILMVAGALYLLIRREKTLLLGWLLAFIGGGALDWALKTIFHRARPAFPDPFVHVFGYSFPSGHAMGSLIGFGMLAYLVIHEVGRRTVDVLVAVGAAVLVVAVGFSRLYLGVHYPSDVLAGFAAGVAWLGANISAVEATAPGRRDQTH